ncbi:DUF6443 domain-containing protein [Chryseobacterium sp. GMJ5]|uniref:DUF6443 domain-containing protein n=1 Tax=Chryseobacterium gilvum TaxID=2976534 RepID=A0ABT2VV76_9FLAO|nr:DUF6443 domain-containing protein [Chryseobacterium gilvum]MCU7613903.1 DUF6443 domain-containing protein [Chryseobacterium gilvum]
MKKIFIPISTLLVAGLVHAQLTPTENYVYSKTYLSDPSLLNPKTLETVQYFDGLGRPKQLVNVKASPLGKDVVTHIEYDGFGRQVKDYLPIPQSSTLNGAIVSSPLGNASSVYGSEKIYADKLLENSPLDRVLEQKQVGNDWNNKPVKFEYAANSEGEVKKYVTTTTWVNGATSSVLSMASDSNSENGNYKASRLYKTTVTDEDGNKTIEFKNGQGQVILVRKALSATDNADTYYVYNEYNQLAFVIPPLASVSASIDGALLNNLCYQYRYDGRNRLVEKKLPGKSWEYMVYDKQDRVVATRDANLESKGQWLFTKYDQFGRVAFTGISTGGGRSAEQVDVETFGSNNVPRISSTSFTLDGMDVHYRGFLAYPAETKYVKLLSVNYYDTYAPYNFNPAFPTTVFNIPVITDNITGTSINTKGLPVMNFIKNIEDDNWTKNYIWYDRKGRAIATHSINHLGGYTKTESLLDFSGTPQQVITKHKRLSSDTEKMISENFEYDAQNRLLVHKHKVDNNAEEILVQNEYNELSQLKTKKVGGTVLGSGLQLVDYTYNIRGWMTKINDPTNLGNDLFGYKINYNQVEGLSIPNSDFPDLEVKPKYNGNISEITWKTSVEENDPLKRYGYAYDPLNRLSGGFYQKEGSEAAKEYFEKLDYDLNGNISRLRRSESVLPGGTTAMLIDNLRYDYLGNRLIKVTEEQIGNSKGYPYFAVPTEMLYDDNGNMTRHKDKGLETILYNYLNLPDRLAGPSGKNQKIYNYLYRADGTKVSKGYSRGAENWTTEYLDGFQYSFYTGPTPPVSISDLKFVPTSEGYYDFENNSYIYNYTDHLGNVRLSYADTNKDGIIQPRQYNVQECDGPLDPMNPPNCTDHWKPGEIVAVNNYYPFGLLHNYTATTQNPYQYKYNGKELQETGMYDYGARFYMPDIGRWGVVDPLAEKMRRWSPYNYVMNNPIRFIDPDGRAVMDPGDKFKNLRAAASDFGKQYNGLSINYNVELRTMFYQATDKSGETYYSYSVPETGSQGMTSNVSPSEVADVSKLGEIVADGHLHAGDVDVIKIDGRDYSSANKFSDRDIDTYENDLVDGSGKKEDNGFGKPVIGYVGTGDGGMREFIPGVSDNSNSGKKDAGGVPIKKYDIPFDTSLPSDPASGSLRLNKIPPTNMPNVLPKGFDPEQPKRY